MHENTAHLVNLRQGVCEPLQQDGDDNMVIFVSNVRSSIVVVNTKSACSDSHLPWGGPNAAPPMMMTISATSSARFSNKVKKKKNEKYSLKQPLNNHFVDILFLEM